MLLISYFSYIYVINSTRKYFIFALNHHLSIKEITRRKNRLSFILAYLFTTSQAPYSFLWIWISIWCYLPSTWRLPLAFLVVQVFWQQILPAFLYLKMFSFHPHLWMMSSVNIKSELTIYLFLSAHQRCCSHHCSPVCKVFSLWLFLWFQRFLKTSALQ